MAFSRSFATNEQPINKQPINHATNEQLNQYNEYNEQPINEQYYEHATDQLNYAINEVNAEETEQMLIRIARQNETNVSLNINNKFGHTEGCFTFIYLHALSGI